MSSDAEPSRVPAPVTTAPNQLARFASFFRSVRTTRCSVNRTATELLADIRGGFWRVRVEAVRDAYRRSTAAADRLKRELPAIAWSGVFDRRNNASLLTHSGLLCLDLDGLGDRLANARHLLVADPHVLAAFLSPSGTGLKVVVPVDARDAETHRACFLEAERYFKGLGLTVDPACKDVARLCFVSFDADASISEGPRIPFSAACALPILPASICTPASVCTNLQQSAPSASLCTTVRENLERRAGIQGELAAKPRLARIWRQFIESRTALPGKRNQFIVQMVPALYEVVDESVIVWFSLAFYDLNRGFFKDGRSQHEAETRAMLKNYRTSYLGKLAAGEKAVYPVLDERGQAGFRICRDLAKRGKGNVFFLSCDDLAARIECDSRQAHRLLCAFTSDGLIEITTPGARRAQGVLARATEYRWKL